MVTGRNIKYIIIFYIFFHFIILFIEDRTRYVPQIVESCEEKGYNSDDEFIIFIKNLWRTTISATFYITIFWFWNFFKTGFILFFFEIIGFYKKEKIIFLNVLNSLIPIYILIFIKFIFIVFIKSDFQSNLLFLYNPQTSFLKYLFNSLEFFKICEYVLLYDGFRKMNVKPEIIILLLLPLFFGENYIKFTYDRG